MLACILCEHISRINALTEDLAKVGTLCFLTIKYCNYGTQFTYLSVSESATHVHM